MLFSGFFPHYFLAFGYSYTFFDQSCPYVLAHQRNGISLGGESFSSPSGALPSMLSPVR